MSDETQHSNLCSIFCFFSCLIYYFVMTGYRVFSLTWPASMQIYWNKRKRLHKKRVQLPQDWFGTPIWPPFSCFGTPIWPPFHCLGHQYGRRDVVWKHSIEFNALSRVLYFSFPCFNIGCKKTSRQCLMYNFLVSGYRLKHFSRLVYHF